MSDKTKIEWTDATWNPVTGCDEVTPGCDHCYAKTLAERFRGTPGHYYEHGFDVALRPDKLDQPLRWKKPRRIFVNSMSDLFHKDIPDEYIAKVFAVMALAPQHTFQLLTKRHGRMRSLLRDECHCGSGHAPGVHLRSAMSWAVSKANPNRLPGVPDDAEQRVWRAEWPLPNVWLGVSVEDQQRANLRIPALLDTPAAIRFLSCEPLLGPVDLAVSSFIGGDWLKSIDWVIVGGESGRGARPMYPDWVRQLRDQCADADVAFHFKQWGEWAPNYLLRSERAQPPGPRVYAEHLIQTDHGIIRLHRVGKKHAGREIDHRTHDDFPNGGA